MRFVELLILAMRLRKQVWQGKLLEECLRLAEKSAAQVERDGFYVFGHCYENGVGCEEDRERAKENYLVAAELEHLHALFCLGNLLDKNDPQRFVWFARAAAKGDALVLVHFLNDIIDIRNSLPELDMQRLFSKSGEL